jgi:hypothetical protein
VAAQIETGSAEGLNDFCDWLIKKGLMTSSAVEPLRSATKQIVATSMTTRPRPTSCSPIRRSTGTAIWTASSGARARSTHPTASAPTDKRAVELYRQYIEQGAGNFKAPAARAVRRRPVKENDVNGANGGALVLSTDMPATPDLIEYPFPLRSRQIAHLHLPPRLEKDDAERMAVVIRALVFEPAPDRTGRVRARVAAGRRTRDGRALAPSPPYQREKAAFAGLLLRARQDSNL